MLLLNISRLHRYWRIATWCKIFLNHERTPWGWEVQKWLLEPRSSFYVCETCTWTMVLQTGSWFTIHKLWNRAVKNTPYKNRIINKTQGRHVIMCYLGHLWPKLASSNAYLDVGCQIRSLPIGPHVLNLLWHGPHCQLPNLHNRSPAAPYQVAIDVLVLWTNIIAKGMKQKDPVVGERRKSMLLFM